MNLIASTFQVEDAPNHGHLYEHIPGETTVKELIIPTTLDGEDTAASGRYPSMVKFRGEFDMIAGMFDRPVVRHIKTGQLYVTGIQPPQVKPAVSASGTGITGTCLCWYQFVHLDSYERIIHQGNFSDSFSISLTNQGRQWTNVPTSSPDARVNGVSGWVSVDGAVPRRAWTRPLGVSSVTENIATDVLASCEPAPLRGTTTDFNARGVWPNVSFFEVYHNALAGAGDPAHPDRVYFSKLYEPESCDTSLTGPHLKTNDGEHVIGIKRYQDELLVAVDPKGFYLVQGYGPRSYSMRKINDYYSLINHFTMVNVGPLGHIWMWTQHGPVVYLGGGAFKEIGGDNFDLFRDDIRNDPDIYINAVAGVDDYLRAYKLLIPGATDRHGTTFGSFYWVGEYDPVLEGRQPVWSNHTRARTDSFIGQMYTDASGKFLETVTGSCDGYVRKENVDSNTDDDGDADGKQSVLAFRHEWMGDQGGDDAHAGAVKKLTVYLKNPDTDVVCRLYAGDDDVYADTVNNPPEDIEFPATRETAPVAERSLRSSDFRNIEGVSGKGVTVSYEFEGGKNIEIRGYAVDYELLAEQQNPTI